MTIWFNTLLLLLWNEAQQARIKAGNKMQKRQKMRSESDEKEDETK